MTVTGKLRGAVDGYRGARSAARASLFWALLTRQRKWLKWLFIALFMQFFLVFVVTNLLRTMVDKGIVDQTVPLWPFVVRIGIWAAILMVMQFTAQQITQRVSYQLEFDMRVWLYTRIQSAELMRLDAVASGQLVTRALTDLDLLERLLGIMPTIVGLGPLMLAIGFFLIFLSPPMAILALLPVFINSWVLSRFRHRLWGLSWAELNERAEVMAAIDEPVRGIRVVKAFGREGHERSKVKGAAERAYRYAMTRVRLLARYEFVLKLIPFLLQAVLLLVGAHLVASKHLSLGTFLIAFQLATINTQLSTIFGDLASSWQYLRSAQSRLAELLSLGRRPVVEGRDLAPSSTGMQVGPVTVDLGGRRVLDDLQFTAAPGSLTVVSGPPGSGKSTLAAVVSGLMRADEGRIVLDGVDLAELDPTAATKAVRVVSEESLLFATTLRKNLELAADPDVDDETIARAVWAAGAEEVIAELPGGIDGLIGDRGLTLSGGQRQRLALARALVSPPRVLIMDDALAAVNPALEIEILRRIRTHAPDMAVIAITRRSGPTALADQVIELPPPAAAPPQAEHVTGLPALDPALAQIVGSLRLTDETPGVPEAEIENEAPPTLGSITRPFRAVVFLGIVVLLIQTGGQLSPQALFGTIANTIDKGHTGQADLRALALLGIGVIYGSSAYGFKILSQRFTQGVIYLLRRRVFHRLSKLGVDFYDKELPGQVATRVVHDLDTLLNFLQQSMFFVVTTVATFVVGMAAIAVISPKVLPLVIAMSAVILLVTLLQLPIGMHALGWSRDELGTVTSKFEEDFSARQEIKNLGAQAVQTRKFVDASWNRRRARWWAATVTNGYSAVMAFFSQFLAALVLWKAGSYVLAGALSIGTALSLQLLANAATQPLAGVGMLYRDFIDARVSWRRLRDPFGVPILPEERPGARACPALEGEVTFDGVGFAYPHTGRTVLPSVTFTIPAGTVTALVGYTGAGKSSIAKLLGRTYDPTAGAVRVDGIDLRDLDLGSYRSRLGIVPQDAFVFKGTVATNIAYGQPDASLDELTDAVEAVGAAELLEGLPGGLEHPVEEEGRNLTAAQRQLLALARAWLARPDILVLDEATSCLDADAEARVMDALGQLSCTTLMVTHREGVARRADAIVVLDGGAVVEAGTASEVIGAGGPYDRLWVREEDLVLTGAAGGRRRRNGSANGAGSGTRKPRRTVRS